MVELNKIYCGDYLKIMKDVDNNSINLIILDPPYNEHKVEWDNIKKYLEMWSTCIKECVRVLKDNGVLYFFQMNINTAIDMHQVCKKHSLILKQMITIDKGLQSVAGRCSKDLRSFPKASEYLFYYTLQDKTGLTQIYREEKLFRPIKDYLISEKKKSNLTNKDFNLLFSKYTNKNGCSDRSVIEHYWQTSQWCFPTKDIYENVLRTTGYFQKPYEELRLEYEDLRYTFNQPMGLTDVWQINFYKDKIDHPTPKPIELIKNIILHSSNPNDIILDPFLGSGTTAVACKLLNRNFIGIEINQDYVKMAQDRLNKVVAIKIDIQDDDLW